MAGDQGELSTPWLLRQLGIERSEAWLVLCGASCLFAVGWADVSLSNVSFVFFNKRVGVEYLPFAFLASSALLIVTGVLLARFVSNRDRSRLLPATFLVLALLLVMLWLIFVYVLPEAADWLLIVSKQFKTAAMLVFWVSLGDLLHGRQAKRLYAPLIAGLTVGSIAGSFASGSIGNALGLEAVLPITAGVLLLGALTSIPLGRLIGSRLERGLAPKSEKHSPDSEDSDTITGVSAMWKESPLFRLLALLVIFGSLVAPMLQIQYQFIAVEATSGAGSEGRLLDLYALINGWLNVAILVVQLKGASLIYRRVGIPLSSAFTPFLYLMSFIGLAISTTLAIGIAATVATRISNQALYQPAIKVLFNLLPESLRARATAFLDGPLDRLGGALGNGLVLIALQIGTLAAVSALALPFALAWGLVAARIWRAYPRLLLGAAGGAGLGGDEERDPAELLDRSTLRSFSKDLTGADLGRCQGALELVSEAKPILAAGVLFETIQKASDERRPVLLKSLVSILEKTRAEPVDDPRMATSVANWIGTCKTLTHSERADLLWVAAHVCNAETRPTQLGAALEAAAHDPEPAVQMVATAALHKSGAGSKARAEVDLGIQETLALDEPAARSAARRELCDLLLEPDIHEQWLPRLRTLETLLDDPELRLEVAETLASVALRHGAEARAASDTVLALRNDRDPRARAAALRFTGYAGLSDRTSWLVEGLASKSDAVARAAEDGLLALGPDVAQALLVGHSFGRRSGRARILSVLRQLGIEHEQIEKLYLDELERLRNTVVRLYALTGNEGQRAATKSGASAGEVLSPIVTERLAERIDEGIRAILLFLAVLKNDNRITELEPTLRRATNPRERSIVLEALESLLGPLERSHLLPLLDESTLEGQVRRLAAVPGFRVPTVRETLLSLATDSDELTRTMTIATWPEGFDDEIHKARRAYVEEYSGMLSPVDIVLLLKTIPLFERLTTRHLMDLAQTMHEERFASNSVVCEEGEVGNCMYLVVEGTVKIVVGGTPVAETGAGDFFGEMALFDGITRSATVTANTDVLLLRLDRNDLMSLMEELPAIAIGLCQVLSHRLRERNIESVEPAETSNKNE